MEEGVNIKCEGGEEGWGKCARVRTGPGSGSV